MKKRIVLGMITAMALSTSIALASPVEMNEGQWNVNLGAMVNPDGDLDIDRDIDVGLDGDAGFYGGVTYGINDRWGVQYDYSHYGLTYSITDVDLDANEFNVLYKLNDHVNVFAGYLYAGGKLSIGGHKIAGSHTDGFQGGLTGWYPLGDKFKTFGKVGLGNNSHVYEIGFSYAIDDNWDLDLSYRDAEYKDFEDGTDVGCDGIRVGLSAVF